jgi:hypothetical protein
MSGSSSARREPESIGDFMKRRLLEAMPEGAVATAHDLYGKAIRLGQDLDLPTARDVLEFGSRALRRPSAQTTARGPVRGSAPRASRTSVAPPRYSVPQPAPRRTSGNPLNRNPYVKDAVGFAGLVAGNGLGPYRAGAHMVRDLIGAAPFVGKALNPFDDLISPPGRSARDQVEAATEHVLDYGKRVVANPHKLCDDLRNAGRKLNIDLNPAATPQADTLGGEFMRTFGVGLNQGELAADIVIGAGGGEAVDAPGAAARLQKATKYLEDAGHADAVAALKQPYKGIGHHSPFAQRTKFPKFLGGGPIPGWIKDSPFDRVKFSNKSKGEAYVIHAGLDKYAKGARLPTGLSVRGWSAKKAGVEPMRGLERIWFGTPEATKSAVGGFSGTMGGLIHEPTDEGEQW